MRTFKLCVHCGKYTILPDLKDIAAKLHNISETYSKLSPAGKVASRKYSEKIAGRRQRVPICKNCGEKLEIAHMDDKAFTRYAKSLYKDFLQFMGSKGKHLPKDIEIRLNKDIGDAMCEYDAEKKRFYIQFNPCYQIYKHNLPSLFFHEFYHLYQLYDPLLGGKKKDGSTIWKNEFEASAIEMMKRLGYKSIDEDKQISMASKIIYDNQTFTVAEYLDFYLDKEAKLIRKRSLSHLNTMSLMAIARSILYYLGQVSVLKNHVDSETFKAISNIDRLEKDLLCFVVCDKDEPMNSFKSIERYIEESAENVDEQALYDIIGASYVWICQHIPMLSRKEN